MVYKEIEIDSTWQQPLGEIRVIQEEADGRELRIYLYDNGSPLDLTGKTVSVYIQKPDNTMIYNSCEVEGNQATVTLTLQMMAVSGLTKLCELQIIDTDNHTLKVTLPPLRIIKSNYDGAIESTDEFSRLAEALNEANNATGIASEAADKANEAAQSANTAAQAANTAAQSANTAADAATSAAESANAQAQAAQTQAAYAKTQGDYAKTQGENAEEIYNQLKDIDVASLQADLDALEASKGQPNGLAALNSSGKLAQMPSASDVGAVPTTRTVNGKALSSNISLTAADVGAVSQTVYQLTPQNGWEVASEASSCYLVVTGKLATLVARLKGINTTISSSSVIFTLPDGIVPQKYIDDVMACSGNFDGIRAIQISTDRQVLAFSGSYTTGPYSINTSFLIN